MAEGQLLDVVGRSGIVRSDGVRLHGRYLQGDGLRLVFLAVHVHRERRHRLSALVPCGERIDLAHRGLSLLVIALGPLSHHLYLLGQMVVLERRPQDARTLPSADLHDQPALRPDLDAGGVEAGRHLGLRKGQDRRQHAEDQ